ncbi:hypothetical protein ON010_g8014 [Phytophthora cinnamomi]|nr:hypothetical protein ON010_g8014 [Phytophthora cinnamomi]
MNMSAPENFIGELHLILFSGDFGSKVYNLPLVYRKIPESKDRYVFNGFSWENAISTDAPAFLFRHARNDVTGFRGEAKIPDDVTHPPPLNARNRHHSAVYPRRGACEVRCWRRRVPERPDSPLRIAGPLTGHRRRGHMGRNIRRRDRAGGRQG